MKTITLKKIYHKERNCIGIFFPKDNELANLVRKLNNSRWSYTQHGWLIDDKQDSLEEIIKVFKDVAKVEIFSTPDEFANPDFNEHFRFETKLLPPAECGGC